MSRVNLVCTYMYLFVQNNFFFFLIRISHSYPNGKRGHEFILLSASSYNWAAFKGICTDLLAAISQNSTFQQLFICVALRHLCFVYITGLSYLPCRISLNPFQPHVVMFKHFRKWSLVIELSMTVFRPLPTYWECFALGNCLTRTKFQSKMKILIC